MTITTIVLMMTSLASAQSEPTLLALSGHSYRYERIRTITTLACAEEGSADCDLVERLALQPVIDWDRLLERAKKSDHPKKPVAPPMLKETVFDQHGGPWIVAISRPKKGEPAPLGGLYAVQVAPDFPGYKISGPNRDVESVEVLRNQGQWNAATEELGRPRRQAQEKKFGFR